MDKIKYIELPKGGIVIDTKIGPIQIGIPPETIKDSLSLHREVPDIYIATKNLFSYKMMASFADLEFPCYYNFFVKKRNITICCTKKQKEIIQGVLKESFFGPNHLSLDIEYINGKNNPFFPKMKKEMDFFAKHPVEDRVITMDDLVKFFILEENKNVNFKGIDFFLDTTSNLVSIYDDKEEYILPWDMDYDITITPVKSEKIFLPPPFGITILGASHGFDPNGKTSGFIFWINGSGVMIDPPIDSSWWLLEENVEPRMVNSVILTHCHADHDAGLMQKILQEGRVTLYTTPTIFSSFIKKASLLTGLSETDIVELIEFIPLTIGKTINIHGAMFSFAYRLHSIPTIGFEVFFKGKTVIYSSDHLNDKTFFDKLYKEEILTQGRYEELSNFNWNKDIIIHEAGIPPIHTPINTLLKLPENIKKHIYLVHTDKTKIPPDSGLTIPNTGLSNTIIIDVPFSVHGESVQILNLVAGLDIFEDIRFEKAGEFLSIIKYRKFEVGDCLIKEGEIGLRFYILIAGKAKLIENGIEKAILSSGSYFGETAIILNQSTTSTVIAISEIIAVIIEKEDFLMFVSNTPIYEKLKKLGIVRIYGSWSVIEANPIFNSMTINQKNYLESLFEYVETKENEIIIKSNGTLDFALVWNTGKASLIDSNNVEYRELFTGDFIGSPFYLLGEKIPNKSLVSKTKCSFFMIKWDLMLNFFQKNPRILLQLKDMEDFG